MKWLIEEKKDTDLIIFRLTSEVSREAFMRLLADFSTGFLGRYCLIDLSEASLQKIREEDMLFLINTFREVIKHRLSDSVDNAKRVAIFAPQDVNFGVARIWQTLLEICRSPMAFEVFRTDNKAMEWLMGSGDVSEEITLLPVSAH